MGKLPSIQKFIAIAPFEISQMTYPKKRCLCLAEETRNAPETDNIIIMQLYIKYMSTFIQSPQSQINRIGYFPLPGPSGSKWDHNLPSGFLEKISDGHIFYILKIFVHSFMFLQEKQFPGLVYVRFQ